MKTKLAILNTDDMNCNYGGVAPFIRNLDPFLQKEYEVTYYYLTDEEKKGKFPHRLKIMWKLWRRRKELNKFDIILSHTPEASFVASFTKTPYIHIYHGNSNPMTISRFWYGKYFAKLYDRLFKRIAHTAVLQYTVGPTWGNVKKLFNPILHTVKPVSIDQRKGFIFAGRLEAGKNIDRIIRMYAMLPANLQADHPLDIAGYGTQEDNLKKLVMDMGMQDKVHFQGGMPNVKLIEEDAKHKVLLMASDKEGLPNAIAEAFSVGVPVISTAAGDIARVLKNDYNGYIFPLDFKDADYVAAMKKALNDYERLSANALESAKIFDASVVTAGLIKDINEIIKSK